VYVKIHETLEQAHGVLEAQEIIGACVHCGFCTATCPTYLELGDERDGPRGRIYLLMKLLEGAEVSRSTQLHLDRCLTCRACETTCPSGVRYGRLADIGRALAEEKIGRGGFDRFSRWLLRKTLPQRRLFGALVGLGRVMRPLLPGALKSKIPPAGQLISRPLPEPHERSVLLLEACGQSALTPATNAAATRVLGRLGISLKTVVGAGCCGAISHHLTAREEALAFMRRNIDAWWPEIEKGAEAVVSTASGCSVMLRDYGELLADDPAYADRAARISVLARDIAEVVAAEDLAPLGITAGEDRVAVHVPCTLYHGLQQPGLVQELLGRVGFRLAPTAEPHLCCGSAGTYSILQPRLSQRLRERKLSALQQGAPDLIVTANVGCQSHLASGPDAPVVHWIELLDRSCGSVD
jgi:glycolate oxidase iron-sulfur subunit